MAEIRPFRGLRYSRGAGEIDRLVAPPYDVLSPQERDALAALDPHNVVWVTLPEQSKDDRSKYVKYARSSARLAEWRREGILALDEAPTLYRYTQWFQVPGSPTEHVRASVIALLKTEPYENGVVLPHEQTFPKHKEDRLRLLEATRAHLESIYGLFEDPEGKIVDRIRSAPAHSEADFKTPDGVRHVLERIGDRDAVSSLIKLMADRRVWIADGHHRYETACAFRAQLGARDAPVAEDYMMMALSSLADPGLVILPTHRIVPKIGVGAAKLEGVFQTRFNTRHVPNDSLTEELRKAQQKGCLAIGVAMPHGAGLLLTLDHSAEALRWIEGPESDRLKRLDVTVLHRLVFEQLLGLRGTDFFSYTRDPEEALAAVQAGAEAAFLMNPPTVDDMREIALGGEKMPQKSTYYYPKLLSGLVLWSLADF